MKTICRLVPLLLGLAAAAGLARGADEAPPGPVEINPAAPLHLKFSDPAKPGTVRLKMTWGDVTVTAADIPDVVVESNIRNQHVAAKAPDGLRRLDSEVTYSAAEKNNVITLEFGSDLSGPEAAGANVRLTVPRLTSVVVSDAFGGKITVKGVAGDVEVHNMNGKIDLDQLTGAALVETMNGEVHASFAHVPADKPLSFTSMNGEIDVRVPADTKANVRLRTHNGAIYTDFDDKVLVTKTVADNSTFTHRIKIKTAGGRVDSDEEWRQDVHDAVREAVRTGMEAAREAMTAAREAAQAAREGAAEANGKPVPPMPAMPPMPPSLPALSGGKVVSGTLNGGGPEIQIATMNGTITLRKLQP
jgi:Toastrack DUF4097